MKTKRLLMRVFLTLNLVGWTLLVSVSAAAAAPPQQGGIRYHTVVRGENLSRIAARYGTTVSAIMARNSIANPNRIFAGQRLAIPTASAAPRVAAPVASGSGSGSCAYRIAWGDTLTAIAARHGTTPSWLMSANGLSNSRIMAGRTLRVPCGGRQGSSASQTGPQVRKSASGKSYRVRRGNTLSGIALLYHTTVGAIMTANGLRSAHHIYAGQVLQIPLR